jgi:hypothetical protein
MSDVWHEIVNCQTQAMLFAAVALQEAVQYAKPQTR